MFCAKCGTKLDDGAAFCHICGERQIPLTQKPQQNTEVEKTMGVFSTETPVPASPVQINQEALSQNVSGSVEKTMGVFSQDPVSQATHDQGGEIIYIKPGTILHGRYTVGEVLGNGGFGITYIGQDNTLQMKVAIKEFFPRALVTRNNTISENVECINSQELFANEKSKVIKEARILAKFAKTPGIVNVLEYFEENNTAYIVMEYIEGGTLKETIKRNGLMTPDYAFSALTPIMQVVGQLHRENVIHRDISPDNIMFDGNQPKLLDFGAAREILGETGDGLSVVLKHGYAPQEQYSRKGNQGTWTDVYSLCATIYYCITGKTPDSALDRIHNDELIRPSQLGIRITPAQENALMQGLSIFPANRLQTIDQFMSAWNATGVQVANNQTNYMQSQTTYSSKPPKQKKNKVGLVLGIVGGSIALLILIIVIASSIGGKSSTNTKPNTSTGTSSPTVTEKDDAKIQEYIDKANELAEKGDYDEAFALLDTAEQLCGSDSKIDSARFLIEKTQLLKTIEKYEANGKLGDAIKAIDSCKSALKNDNEIVQKRNSLKQTYISTVIESADSALKANGYEAAMAVINDALSVLPSEQKFKEKQTEYENYKPVDLFSLEYFNAASNFGFEGEGPQVIKDNEGNTHYKSYEFERDYYHSNTWVEYKIDKKYNKLSGTFFLDYDWRTTKEEAHFYVYGDGKLLYDGVQTGGKVPFDFDINITNVEILKIEYKTNIWTTSGFTHSVCAGIFDNTYIVKTK